MRHLKTMLWRLCDVKLYVKFSKCEFWLDSISFLVHVVTKDGIMVDLAKKAAICDWARPTSPMRFSVLVV